MFFPKQTAGSGHELSTLVRVEDIRCAAGAGNGLLAYRKHQPPIMVSTHLSGQDLSGKQVFNGSQVPPSTGKVEETDIGAPDLVGSGGYQISNEVGVSMMTS